MVVAAYRERRVVVVAPPQEKRVEFRVEWPLTGAEGPLPVRGRRGAERRAPGRRVPLRTPWVPAIAERLGHVPKPPRVHGLTA